MFGKNKSSRGFTIVELLLTIVIIGILSTLVFVSYTGISDIARKTAFASSANNILKKIKYKEVDDGIFDPLNIDETNLSSELNIDAKDYDQVSMYKLSNDDYIYIVGKNAFSNLVACGVQGGVSVYNADDASCALGGSAYSVVAVKDTDSTPGAFGGGNGSTCPVARTIDSIEDLVYFSNSVNSGTTYSGVCIKLAVDLDFAQSKSYVNYKTTAFGDINGNGTTEGLKVELTTGAGFKPIGDNTHSFNGTFLGEQHTIYDLMINRPTTDYVGFFGYSLGMVSGLSLANISVVGKNNTGGVVGYVGDSSRLLDTTVNGNITGNTTVGVAVGFLSNYAKIASVVASGNITGSDKVGGVVGATQFATVKAVNLGATITSANSSVGRISGDPYGTNLSGYAVSSTTINGSTITSSDLSSKNGTSINAIADITADINAAEAVLDTYIGGDDGDDGYYWDYDGSGTLIKKSTTTSPIIFNLSGSGTTDSPYLIADYNDLRQASLKPTSSFKLTADIDMSGKKFYMLGNHANSFTGTFYGNQKTVSNISIDAPAASYLGFIGYNNGIVTGLNLTNINIIGNNYIAGAIGYLGDNHSKLLDTTVSGNITGNTYVGMAVGFMDFYSRIFSIITSGNITGSSNVGGVIGRAYYGTVGAINLGGNITCTNSEVGRIVGTVYASGISGYAVSSTKVNGSTLTSNDLGSTSGTTINSIADVTTDINAADAVLDTYIGGDDGSDGYYWDYDGDGNLAKLNTNTNPLTFNLTGAGTSESPYLISDYNDLKQASLRLDKVYKLTTDINMSGKKFYMIGSRSNGFTGTFYGNQKTISNLTINAPFASYLGFIGYNNGILKGLNLTNVNIVGNNNIAGAIGAQGDDGNKKILDSTISGNITGNMYVGMAVGYSGFFDTIASVITSGNVTGSSHVGGVVGRSYYTTVRSVNAGGSVTGTVGDVGRIAGSVYGSNLSDQAISSVTVNGSTVTSDNLTNNNGKDIIASDLSVSTTYTNIGFNFTDEALDYIWYIDGSIAKFREGSL